MRRGLAARGVDLRFAAIADVSHIDTRPGRHEVGRVLADVHADIDPGMLIRRAGGKAFVQFYSKLGQSGSEQAGDVQGFSNIDVPSFAHFGEVWYERELLAQTLRVKAGRLDANSDFARVEAAGDFLNGSMGYSPTILVFPTYPSPRTGVVVAADPSSHVGVSVGTYDVENACSHLSATTPHTFVIGELRTRWAIGRAGLAGRGGAGIWRHTGHAREADDYPANVAHSPFITLEQDVWRGESGSPERSVGVFTQYGAASANHGVDRHISAGLVWNSPWKAPDGSTIGTAITRVRLRDVDGDAILHAAETTFAVFFKHEIAAGVAVQPDVQYIAHPGGAPDRGTWAATWRVRVEM